jgi:hypothetical protein
MVGPMSDVLVVGSGASGVMAAAALIDAGRSVTLVDYGAQDRHYAHLIPDLPFTQLRRSDPDQHRYFLGDDFEGIPFGEVRVGAQLTPSRMHIAADAPREMPVDSGDFAATESLALGGLATGWGAGAFPFTKDELEGWPVSIRELEPHYWAIAERIGVCGAEDDLTPFYGDTKALLPPLEIDTNAETLLARYEKLRGTVNRLGLYVGRPRLAICSVAHRGRGPHPYHDMDFWTDDGARSVYRPRWTLEELMKSERFAYVPDRFALSFRETERGVELKSRHAETNEVETREARALVIAAGAMSTARIVLRSLGAFDRAVPLLSNAYTYAPVINSSAIGKEPRDPRHSLSQLAAVYRPSRKGPIVHAQYYTYRSLLMFKLLKESPLPFREGIEMMRLLMPLFGILGIHHEDRPTEEKFLRLRREGDEGKLEIRYRPSAREMKDQKKREIELLRLFRRLGCTPMKLIRPGHGSSIHYGGCFPMRDSGSELTTTADGRLAGTRAVYLADGSVFPYLPAKGLTFTMMANAHRIGVELAKRLDA